MSETPNPTVALVQEFYRKALNQRDDDIACQHPFSKTDLSMPWYHYDRVYRGYQWDFLEEMDAWASLPVKNMAHIAVESYTTMLTDTKPSVQIFPREDSDKEYADLLRAGVNYWWDKEYMAQKVALGVKASRIFGIGWLYVYHDSTGEHCRVIHPESVLVDPNCTVENYDPAYVILEDITTVGALEDKYPEHEDFEDFQVGWQAGLNTTDRVEYKRYGNSENPDSTTPIYYVWMKDTASEDAEANVGGTKVKGKKKKYPKGRYLVVAGAQVLEDKENVYKHGEFPLTPIHAYPVPGRFYGVGDIQNILNIQVMRNRMSQFVYDQSVRAGGGKALVSRRSGIDPTKVTNAPFQVLPCDDASEAGFRIVQPPAVTRAAFEYIQMLDMDADDAMGLHDITKGSYTPGNKTAQEVAVISESDRTRVRMAARWLTWALERVGKQLVSNLAQWHDWEWFVRIGDSDKSQKLSGADLKGKSADFDISFVDSSTLPPSQQQTRQTVEWLVGLGVISPDMVLKYKLVDIPHADEILADMEKAAAEQAQQAAPQGAMPPMGGAMPPGMPPELMAMMGGGMPPAQMPPMAPPAQMAAPLAPTDMQPSTDQYGEVIQEFAREAGLWPEEVIALLQQLVDQQGGMTGAPTG